MQTMISGGPIANSEGWAKIPFAGRLAHYWLPDEIEGYSAIHKGERVSFWKSRCGVEATTYKGVSMLERGNWPMCKRCGRLS
ncbi:hypothetical protein [Pseudohongiella sp. O18]|uniref:hypothetical protein n=1 Tax=Pseudohongiella sp. O18 TaxID=2904248 RepID=UPI001F15B846|nr:hypothetical protein [Pseudohongiella sp. O18]